jgi:hypothetical protein
VSDYEINSPNEIQVAAEESYQGWVIVGDDKSSLADFAGSLLYISRLHLTTTASRHFVSAKAMARA